METRSYFSFCSPERHFKAHTADGSAWSLEKEQEAWLYHAGKDILDNHGQEKLAMVFKDRFGEEASASAVRHRVLAVRRRRKGQFPCSSKVRASPEQRKNKRRTDQKLAQNLRKVATQSLVMNAALTSKNRAIRNSRVIRQVWKHVTCVLSPF